MNLRKFYQNLHSQKNNKIEGETDLGLFKETPRYKFGMFVKIVGGGEEFKKQLCVFYDKDKTVKVDIVGEFLLYNRAWFWIDEFDKNNSEWVEAIGGYEYLEVLSALDLCIKFFEDLEEYERCSHLITIKGLLKERAPPKNSI
tara:strand:+ start:542 stop:970 length:429 start_codon:yes stop_codon:yes gene_type:complete